MFDLRWPMELEPTCFALPQKVKLSEYSKPQLWAAALHMPLRQAMFFQDSGVKNIPLPGFLEIKPRAHNF